MPSSILGAWMGQEMTRRSTVREPECAPVVGGIGQEGEEGCSTDLWSLWLDLAISSSLNVSTCLNMHCGCEGRHTVALHVADEFVVCLFQTLQFCAHVQAVALRSMVSSHRVPPLMLPGPSVTQPGSCLPITLKANY